MWPGGAETGEGLDESPVRYTTSARRHIILYIRGVVNWQMGGSVANKRNDVDTIRCQAVSSAQLLKFHEYDDGNRYSPQFSDDVERGGNGPAGSEEIVYQQHPLSRKNSVTVHLKCVGGVLQCVFPRHGFGRELP